MDSIFLYLVVGFLSLVIIILTLTRPVWGLAFTISSLPLYYLTILPAGFNFTSLTGILGGLTLISLLFHTKGSHYKLGRDKIPSKLDRLLYVLVILLSLEILIWDFLVPVRSRLFFITYIQLFLLIWLAEKIVRAPEQLELIMKMFVVVNLVALAFSLRNFDFFSENPDANRLVGLAGNANEFSIYVGVSMLFIIYFFEQTKNRIWKIILLVVGLFLFIPILLSGSRGGFLFLVVVMSYQLWRFQRSSLFLVGVLFVLALLNSDLVARGYIDRVLAIPTDLATQSDTVGLRINLWRYAIELWKASPLWGIGTGMFLYRSIESPVLHGTRMLVAHNTYVTYLVENGVIGLAFFLIITAKSVFNYESAIHFFKDRNLQLKKLAITWQSALLIYALNGFKGNLNTAKIFWLSFGISMVFTYWLRYGVPVVRKENVHAMAQYHAPVPKSN